MPDHFVFKKIPPVIDNADGVFLPISQNSSGAFKIGPPPFDDPDLGLQPQALDKFDGIDGESFTDDGLFVPVAFQDILLV